MAARSIGALVAALLLTAASPARAGTYHVYSCRTPSGESAPTDGWAGSVTGTYAYAINTCSEPGGALLAALGDEPSRTANADFATWTFTAPAFAQMTAATIWRAGDADGGGALNASYEMWFAGPSNFNDPRNAFDQCVGGPICPSGLGNAAEPLATENRVEVPRANLSTALYANASCSGESGFPCPEGQHDPNDYAAAVYLYAADMTLEQDTGPSAGNVGGELASAVTVQGTSDVTFSATDPGAGVYEAVFSVDGQVAQSTVLDENGGRCRNVGATSDGTFAFLYLQPCLDSLSADVGLDTTRLGNGSHHIVVSVVDAAGNSAPVLDRTITVDNPTPPGSPGPANGTPASASASLSASWAGTRRSTLTSAFGHPAEIVGRLLAPGDVPVAGAQIAVSETPAYAGARSAAMPTVYTDSAGRFTVRVSAGASSRRLRLTYASHLGESRPTAAVSLTLAVRAGIALRITPRTASAGSSIFFGGRLLGGPIPAAGKQLVLEARSPGSEWIEFDVIRAGRRGRFHASYRFRFPGPVLYQFRVLSEAESDYPFASGASNVVSVFEH